MDLSSDLPEKPTNEAVINLANRLLKEFRIPTRIVEVQDITSSLFVVLYESLFSDRLPDIIRQPISRDDDIHNCQTVIDVLSNDVIHDSLSHIRGVDIVAGDLTSIFNLLDIFSHLLEYVLNKIESDHEDTRSVGSVELNQGNTPSKKTVSTNSKKLSQGTIDKSLPHSNVSKDGKHLTHFASKRTASLNKNENRKAYDDHKIISHEDFYAMTYGGLSKHQSFQPLSPIRPDRSGSLLGHKTVDSTEFDILIEKVDRLNDLHLDNPKIAWDSKPVSSQDGQFAVDAAVIATSSADKDKPPKTTATSTTAAAFSATVPPSSQSLAAERRDLLRSTVGPITYHTHPTPGEAKVEKTPEKQSMSNYYNNLRQLVKKTAAMTRMALETSPVRSNTVKDLNKDMEEPRPALSSEGVRLAQELNAMRMNPCSNIGQSPGGKKKVAFASSHLLNKDDIGGPALDRCYEDGWISDSEQDLDTVFNARGFRQQQTSNGRSGPSCDLLCKKPKSFKPKNQTKAFARHLARNRQPELGAAHLLLKNEDLAIRKKQELLREFYEKDHEEFKEDVDYMLGRDHEKAAETEENYVKKCAAGAVRKKGTQKVKGASTQTHKKPKKKQCVAKRRICEDDLQASSPPVDDPVALESEEDLIPYLMDEFPYLHLTEHTWHELWRKGLHQIEALTRAYQDIERKKSRAQSQLEEAAERHSLLSEIMKKQLQHSQRMQEIKEQKQTQIHMRNKMSEKRIQSARARRYYNEYQVRARAKVLKKRTKEELVFRELFKDALNIQRERIKDIRKYASDQRKRQEEQRQNEIDSLENYYHNQFEILAERLAQERLETEIREAAQNQMLDRMKRELRNKMESEIKQYQEQMFHDDDDSHFRQIDADRIKQYLHMARYSVKI